MTNLIAWLSSCAMCDEFIYVILLRKPDGNIKIWWGNKVICTEKSLKFLSSVFGVELSPTKIRSRLIFAEFAKYRANDSNGFFIQGGVLVRNSMSK